MNTPNFGHASDDQGSGPEIEADLARTARTAEPKHPSYGRLLTYLAQQPPSLIGIDACAGAQNLARELHRLGHFVKIIYPPFPAR